MAKGLCEGDDAEAARAMPPPRPRLVGPHHTPHAAAGIVSVPPLLPRSSTDGLGTGGSAATRSMDSVAVHMEGACGSASGLSHEASDCHGSARGGEEVEGKRRVDSGEDDDCLPPNWKTVPSRSRPGQHSYVHVPTGLKQSKRPSEDPTEEAVEAFRLAVANAKRQVSKS